MDKNFAQGYTVLQLQSGLDMEFKTFFLSQNFMKDFILQ